MYELRVYRCMPGRRADLLARFRDHTMGFFRKHGIDVIGFWTTVVGEQDDLVYIVRYESWADRERNGVPFKPMPNGSARGRKAKSAAGWWSTSARRCWPPPTSRPKSRTDRGGGRAPIDRRRALGPTPVPLGGET